MWENNSKKILIRNIIIGLLLVVISFGLFRAISTINAQIEAEDRELSEARKQQQQQLSEAREENLEAVKTAYENDMQTVAQYLPGIVCWGDSLTTGSSGNVSYPYTLQKYINSYLCSAYNFRSTITDPASYPSVTWADYTVSIPVVNMGAGRDNNDTILGMAGVRPYVTRQDFVIPAQPEPVAITLASPNGREVTPLATGSESLNPVTIAGVEGTLMLDSSAWDKRYLFERSEPGTEVIVSRGTELITACASEYQDYIHIVWLGAYAGTFGTQSLIEDISALLQRQTRNSGRYLVISPCNINGDWSGQTLDNLDSAMLQAFGSHYVNLRKYLAEDGLADAGMGMSHDDKISIAQGSVPNSFRSVNNSAELNARAYELLGKLVYERMDRLGYFDEVRSELGIENTYDSLK